MTAVEVLVADECWIALALLHRSHPERPSFTAREILERLKLEKAQPELRPGVQPHIYLHNVANLEPNSARYRMFYRLPDGTYRLFRPGDDFHPARAGKTAPKRSELPQRYHELLDWYQNEYCKSANRAVEEDDPILQMWGVGKHLWAEEGGDAFIARMRAGWTSPRDQPDPFQTAAQLIWGRIVLHQGEKFHTSSLEPFTYAVESGSEVRFYRDGHRVPDPGFSHWLGLLHDSRIRYD